MNPKYSRTLFFLIFVIILYKAFKFFIFPVRPTIKQIIIEDESGQRTEKVKVSVHYEALCPDSKFFITHQLVPVYNELKQFLLLDLIPYGKAETIIDENGKIDFHCQHDQVECFANKIHACVIDKITDPEIQVKFVACMITDNLLPEDAGERCGRELNLDFSPINKCAIEQEGSLLLKKHGERTNSLHPKVKFIPTIELNNNQSFETQAVILKNLLIAVCRVYQHKPPMCSKA
ncbi:unnamed protein product [Ceutorhynchus assimilis]|uniref:Gamma-interferon-inducible lysosomal thiol reductase n=1 Tax=Ceutorhynchus assimilis TaxID=467358 RepID=A0A9N9Q8F4_9CUCU|nr:unnamed protein product [Ceutorhynchus assimilis]